MIKEFESKPKIIDVKGTPTKSGLCVMSFSTTWGWAWVEGVSSIIIWVRHPSFPLIF